MTKNAVIADKFSERIPDASSSERFVDVVKLASWRGRVVVVTAIAIATQLAFFPSLENVVTSGLMLLGNVLGFSYALRQSILRRYPISTLMLLGYVFSYFTLPPWGQLLGFQSIVHRLHQPVEDQVYAILGLLALISGHLLYRKMKFPAVLRRLLRQYFYKPLGFYRSPRISQIWLMGFVGVVAILAGRHYNTQSQGGVVVALMQGLRPFIYMPYITLLLPAWSPLRRIPQLQNAGLFAYTAVLLALAMLVNSRAYLLVGFASLSIIYVFLVIIGKVPLPKLRTRNVILLIVTAWLVTGPLANLSMAMVLVRGERTDLTPTELMAKTWDTFVQGGVVQRFEQIEAMQRGAKGTNETYFDNLFLNRLANLKFLDNATINSKKLNPKTASDFSRIEWLKVVSIIPGPLLHALDVHADKKFVTDSSSGSFLLYEVTENPSVLVNGFQTGSLLVNMAIMFGWIWPLVLILLVMLLFPIVDAWVQVRASMHTNEWNVQFNPLIIGMMFTNTFFLTSAATGIDSIAGLFDVLIRGWVQVGVLYAAVYWITLVAVGRLNLSL